jgi:hypothetical protein
LIARMTSRGRFTPAWLVLLAAGACQSRGPSGPTAAQACADLAMALCNLRSACSRPQGTTGVGAGVLEAYGDLQTCVAREALACASRLAAPKTGETPATVEGCVAKFDTYSCVELFENVPPSDCIVVGGLPDGAPCLFDGQCQSAVCVGTKAALCGTCGNPPGAGEDCSATPCVRGDRCVAATHTCVDLVTFNSTCNASLVCAAGLTCVASARDAADAGDAGDAGQQGRDAGMTPMRCENARARVGDSCAGPPGCDPTRGLYCGADQLCAAVAYGGAGCGLLPDGTRAGCVAGSCDTGSGPASATDMGACVPFAPDGYPCDTAIGPGCMAPARCVAGPDSTAGTCVIPQPWMCSG